MQIVNVLDSALKVSRALAIASLISLFFALGAASAQAHPGVSRHIHGKPVLVAPNRVVRAAPVRSLAARSVGEIVTSLPSTFSRINFQGRTWFLADGVYFTRHARGYAVARPVAGLRLASLPRGFTIVRSAGTVRYRYLGVTYRRINHFYVVV